MRQIRFSIQELLCQDLCCQGLPFAALALLATVAFFCQSVQAQEAVTLTTINNENIKVEWESLTEDGQLLIVGGDAIKLKNVTSIVSAREASASMGGKTEIRLIDGGTLFGTDIKIVDEQVSFASDSGIVSIPLPVVRAIVWDRNQATDLVEQAINEPSTEKDVVFAAGKSSVGSVGGLVEQISDGVLTLNYNGKSRPIALEKLVAVVVTDLKLPRVKGVKAMVTLVDGSSVGGVFKSADERLIHLTLSGNETISIPRASFLKVDVDSEGTVFLSSLQPREVEQKPVFTAPRDWQKDRSVAGNPITLLTDEGASKVFSKGIGVQSFSRLVFENTDDYDRFRAFAGIDVETNGRGDCQMTVLGDGIELWSQRVRANEVAVAIDVDISGINEVELIVYPGESFDLADHADWADAKFMKTK